MPCGSTQDQSRESCYHGVYHLAFMVCGYLKNPHRLFVPDTIHSDLSSGIDRFLPLLNKRSVPYAQLMEFWCAFDVGLRHLEREASSMVG